MKLLCNREILKSRCKECQVQKLIYDAAGNVHF